MKKNKLAIGLLTIVLCGVIYFTYNNLERTTNDESINCAATVVIYHEDKKISLLVTYLINGDSGVSFIQGSYSDKEKETKIDRRVYFTIDKKYGDFIHVRSRLTTVPPSDNSSNKDLKSYIPAIYLQKNMRSDFSISHQGKDSYVFSTEFTPVLYCQKKN